MINRNSYYLKTKLTTSTLGNHNDKENIMISYYLLWTTINCQTMLIAHTTNICTINLYQQYITVRAKVTIDLPCCNQQLAIRYIILLSIYIYKRQCILYIYIYIYIYIYTISLCLSLPVCVCLSPINLT